MAPTFQEMKTSTRKAPSDNSLFEVICSIARLQFEPIELNQPDERTNDPTIQGLAMLSEEINRQRQEIMKLKRRNIRLERYNYTVAHDLKSPLLASLGIIELLEQEASPVLNDEQQEYLSLLKEANNQGIEMVKDILEYAQAKDIDLRLEEVPLEFLKSEISKIYRSHSLINIFWPPSLPVVHHNITALKQIFCNLIGNSIKHSDKEICEVRIEHWKDKKYHYLGLADNGLGIKYEDCSKIFDLFESLDTSRHFSHGIGLAIVKQLVQAAGGNVWIDSDFHTGARFILSIPKR